MFDDAADAGGGVAQAHLERLGMWVLQRLGGGGGVEGLRPTRAK